MISLVCVDCDRISLASPVRRERRESSMGFIDDVRAGSDVVREVVRSYSTQLDPLAAHAADLLVGQPDRLVLVVGMGSSLAAGRVLTTFWPNGPASPSRKTPGSCSTTATARSTMPGLWLLSASRGGASRRSDSSSVFVPSGTSADRNRQRSRQPARRRGGSGAADAGRQRDGCRDAHLRGVGRPAPRARRPRVPGLHRPCSI